MSGALEVLAVFTRLGLSSFGGPTAHIGYFRDEFVVRRRWLDEPAFADLVALCQFLPGPGSSQLGFAIGLMRAGFPGALAAWAGFTAPSAILLTGAALGAGRLTGPGGGEIVHGLKLVAVAIVANAVWGMARSLCPDRIRAGIALAVVALVFYNASSLSQIAAILLGGIAGYLLCRSGGAEVTGRITVPVSRPTGLAALALFVLLLAGLPALDQISGSPGIALFDVFYRSGALVFGGGHVVLPLLRDAVVVPGWVGDDAFLSGYGLAQAVPGPLFTFAAYLGGVATASVAGAVIGLIAIFLPGILVLIAALPFWDGFRQSGGAQAAMRGIGAAVVGLLGATLYSPLWTSSVSTIGDAALALAGFALLVVWRVPPLVVVVLGVVPGIAAAVFA